MIKYQELRPDNIVNHKGETMTVTSVSAGFEPPVIVLSNYDRTGIFYIDEKEIDPIPFTQEWKTQMNLDKIVINGFFVDVSEHGGYGFFVITDIESEPMGKLELCQIRGVHHVQNLFQENTNYEIKIK